jgi:hypothetical protein
MLVEAAGGGCFLSQKPSQNHRPDTSSLLAGFETRFPRAPVFFPPASTPLSGVWCAFHLAQLFGEPAR